MNCSSDCPRADSASGCSQVLVVGRSLDVLDVRLVANLDSTVGQLLVIDRVLAIKCRARASPVPVQAANVLQTGHLLIGQVGEDLDHVTTVAIVAEHIVVDQVTLPDTLLEEDGSTDKATDDPLGLHGVSVNQFLHDY